MKYWHIILFVLVISSSNLLAQEQRINYNKPVRVGEKAVEKGFSVDKMIYGGGLFGGAGYGYVAAGFTPMVGYRINDYFSAGISLGYQYYNYKDRIVLMHPVSGQFLYYNLQYHIITPGLWGRVVLFKNFFIHSEFEYHVTNYKNYEFDRGQMRVRKFRDNITVPCLLVGGGLRQPMSDRASFVLYALYDVLQNIPSNQVSNGSGQMYSKSPYANRLDIRIGVNVGF